MEWLVAWALLIIEQGVWVSMATTDAAVNINKNHKNQIKEKEIERKKERKKERKATIKTPLRPMASSGRNGKNAKRNKDRTPIGH